MDRVGSGSRLPIFITAPHLSSNTATISVNVYNNAFENRVDWTLWQLCPGSSLFLIVFVDSIWCWLCTLHLKLLETFCVFCYCCVLRLKWNAYCNFRITSYLKSILKNSIFPSRASEKLPQNPYHVVDSAIIFFHIGVKLWLSAISVMTRRCWYRHQPTPPNTVTLTSIDVFRTSGDHGLGSGMFYGWPETLWPHCISMLFQHFFGMACGGRSKYTCSVSTEKRGYKVKKFFKIKSRFTFDRYTSTFTDFFNKSCTFCLIYDSKIYRFLSGSIVKVVLFTKLDVQNIVCRNNNYYKLESIFICGFSIAILRQHTKLQQTIQRRPSKTS